MPPCCVRAGSIARSWCRAAGAGGSQEDPRRAPQGKRTALDVDVDSIARGSPGSRAAPTSPTSSTRPPCSPCAGAATQAADFDAARDRVILASNASRWCRAEDLERTAYHEAGHALCAALQDNYDPVHKVTIIPTGYGARRHHDPSDRGSATP
ncbi:MAG: hypothetical protein R2695_03670 [Acidimicrobiales bacterium]